MSSDTPRIDYDGPQANAILSRSLTRWQTAFHLAKSTREFPESSFKLEALLSRVPSLPDNIPSSSTWIEGYSTWANSDALCALKDKIEKTRRFSLRSQHPTTCRLSTSNNFKVWERNPNNGIALLVLGWAYILSASLAEKQQLLLKYAPLDDYSGTSEINLDYASAQELRWWKAIVAPGVGWNVAGDRPTPWAVLVDNLDLEMAGEIDVTHPPPTARQAANYLARLCAAFDLGNQCSAALAAALSLPLHRSTSPLKSVTIELPRPSLQVCVASPSQDQDQYPTDFRLIGYYMTLSLAPSYFGSALFGIFWEPDVPCNFTGAWLSPISDILRPILLDNSLELLAKILSFTNVAPLWLGVVLCGPGAIIKSIMPFLDQLRPYPYAQPFVDAAAWTGTPQSFMDSHPTGPYLQLGRISRANVWRLRHDCHMNYDDDSFSATPLHGWPPFGTMEVEDIELELHDHLNCSHQWRYNYWTWLPNGVRDFGYSEGLKDSQLPQNLPPRIGLHEPKDGESKINYDTSRIATEKAFRWCCSQVEKGFGGSLVPYCPVDGELDSAESDSGSSVDRDAIHQWRENLE
ncbi:hypothetical protein ONS95_002761 [Cadophora gregata]|uniref:uncharacterized protein n=1 Tax=Cadophora gregata TaxID=51156 RepID=UPI0026DC96B5|nr:uncharacterized protein ONS95_002761 [Cadophora gregata]KAK0110105.1 hypothetical protein ONS95_002761 [Cadophora gregata]KAK0110278.1 hypothetical protein ONS96_001897 [Cadophora gregata f. sp. sojae]